jgi:hypothetical protein
MRRTVVLLHSRNGVPDHFDWMIDQPELVAERRLMTFKVPYRPDKTDSFLAEKTPDHRAIYLDYEGEVSGGRGMVTRVAEGIVHKFELSTHRLRLRIDWGEGVREYVGTQHHTEWSFLVAD